eukprot:TRINITY_DN6473_c0_g1_i1.p1 TRINITY_DN6473_c0_g1~~TRINITY_DN6473_c0_g1_i1.p1  ORF type:complete len:473 (+),score=110.60 TRINITY_DN6473_c0_g1_i1:43-1461(+)
MALKVTDEDKAEMAALLDANPEVAANEAKTFRELGLEERLCEACEKLGWKTPTPIQVQAIPYALQGQDVIGLAQTGSGKTAAFALPIVHHLLERPQGLFACVLAPTRELAFQISEQFEAVGSIVGVKSVVIVGGIDMMDQAIALAKKPHIVVATPGRLLDHLENTKGFSLRNLKHLVLDEADRLLDMDFGDALDKILKLIPKERQSALFSATMTQKVQKLQRACLVNPAQIKVSNKYSTVSTLVQQYIFHPAKYKDCYLAYLLNEMAGNSTIVFVATCLNCQRLALLLRNLGFSAIPLHGQLSQSKRLSALAKFKAGDRSILIATDVAARGLDIPTVDVVINFDLPTNSKNYIHRVGRTARAGRGGRAINIVTQYDVEVYQRIEELIGKKLEQYPTEQETVLLMLERVTEAQRIASMELRDSGFDKKRKVDDDEEEEGGSSFNQKKDNDGRRPAGKPGKHSNHGKPKKHMRK